MEVRCAQFADLGTATLYAILKLRVDVFVVEQRCIAPELDGRDGEPGTSHCWIEEDGEIIAYLRILAEPSGSRIGRVVTASAKRRRGHASALLRYALARATPPVVLHAQVHLKHWYARFGFEPVSAEFLEDGIPHLRMCRLACGVLGRC